MHTGWAFGVGALALSASGCESEETIQAESDEAIESQGLPLSRYVDRVETARTDRRQLRTFEAGMQAGLAADVITTLVSGPFVLIGTQGEPNAFISMDGPCPSAFQYDSSAFRARNPYIGIFNGEILVPTGGELCRLQYANFPDARVGYVTGYVPY